MKTRMNFVLVLAAVLILSISSASDCLAVDKFVFTPKLKGHWLRESNYFRSEANERSVDTYLLRPGIELGYETAKTQITLDATLDWYNYRDNDDVPAGQRKADEFDFTGYTGLFNLVTLPVERLQLLLNDQFLRTRDQGQSDRFSNAVDRTEFIINRFNVGGFYEFSERFTAGLRYNHQMLDYVPDFREDSYINRGVADVIYNLSRTSLLDLNYQYWHTSYSKISPDYVSNQVRLDYRQEFSQLTFSLGAGYHHRNFDSQTKEDQEIPIFLVDFGWRNPGGAEGEPVTFASLTWERNLNELGYLTGYHKSHRVDLTAGHTFMEKIPVQITGTYLTADYDDFIGPTPAGAQDTRYDETHKLMLKAGYIITHWITVFAEGGIDRRNSNLAGFDYNNDLFRLGFESAFNFGAK